MIFSNIHPRPDYEEGVDSEVVTEFIIQVGCGSKGPYVYELDTEKGFGIAADEVHQSLDQVLGFAAAGAYEDLIACVYVAENLFFCCELLWPGLL